MKNTILKKLKYTSVVAVFACIFLSTFSCSAQINDDSNESTTENKENSGDQEANSVDFYNIKSESLSKLESINKIILNLKSQDLFPDKIHTLELKITDLTNSLQSYNPENKKDLVEFKENIEKEIEIIENSLYEMTGNNK